jgi:hypothetical protein
MTSLIAPAGAHNLLPSSGHGSTRLDLGHKDDIRKRNHVSVAGRDARSLQRIDSLHR